MRHPVLHCQACGAVHGRPHHDSATGETNVIQHVVYVPSERQYLCGPCDAGLKALRMENSGGALYYPKKKEGTDK